MKAKNVCTPSPKFLQEVSEDLDPISQCALEDLETMREDPFSAWQHNRRAWREHLEVCITARLEVGVPIENGPLTADLNPAGLFIQRKDEGTAA